ncbi:MAG: amino acid permease [Halieaceae bacterium]|nr:amino acid permease [Halieaceae bacterium]
MAQGLKRAIGLPGLIFYGVGTMVGGGIYALLGKVAAEAQLFTPWAILIAGLMALFSAFSFAELSARFPKSSGPAFYLSRAFDSQKVGALFGWLVIATGVVSSATLTVAVSGFLLDLAVWPAWIFQLTVVIGLCLIASWGVQQSVTIVAIIAVIEVAGLLLVIAVNLEGLTGATVGIGDIIPSVDSMTWVGIFAGSFLAFYAFIGFEDLVTLAEEVKGVKRNLPLGIIISMLITLLLYILISLVAITSTDMSVFSQSHTPMAILVSDAEFLSPTVLVVISLLAGLNGALVQIVMAARILYGMGGNRQALEIFSRVHPTTQTPVIASVAVSVIVLLLAWLIDLATLARITSGIILFVFAGVNLALIIIKKQDPDAATFTVPAIVPYCGLLISAASLLFAVLSQLVLNH